MRRFFKRLFSFVFCFAFAFVIIQYGPNIYMRLFGDGNARWISERFSETLREKNELVVYEVETTGQETVSQDAWLIGTVQKVEMPYTFSMAFTVDLSNAQVTANENIIEVRVPSPKPGYQKLVVEEERVRKVDWLYRLTPERYAEIKQQVEDELFAEYSQNAAYLQNAWNVTVHNLESLFEGVAQQAFLGSVCEVKVIADDSLNHPLPTVEPIALSNMST